MKTGQLTLDYSSDTASRSPLVICYGAGRDSTALLVGFRQSLEEALHQGMENDFAALVQFLGTILADERHETFAADIIRVVLVINCATFSAFFWRKTLKGSQHLLGRWQTRIKDALGVCFS